MDFTKIKSICASKDIIKKEKRQPTEWEKIFANHISDNGVVSKICIYLLTHTTQLIKRPITQLEMDKGYE